MEQINRVNFVYRHRTNQNQNSEELRKCTFGSFEKHKIASFRKTLAKTNWR